MERLSDNAIEIVNELHTERLAYESEYVPIIDALNRLAEYEDIGLEPEKVVFLKNVVDDVFSDKPEFIEHKEYIEREATIELLRSIGSRDYRREKGTIQEAIKMVSFSEYTPAADVAPVVRCKDCKWYSELVCGEGKLLGSQGWCNEVMARPMPSNGFCSFGERENND